MNILSNEDMTAERFIEVYAKVLAGWGMPLQAGRVYAYLLLQSRAMSLDEIAAGLGVSKASVWGAAGHLERVHQIERFRDPGSKRARFAPVENSGRTLFSTGRLLSKSGNLMRQAAAVADGPEARERLLERSEFFLAVHAAVEAAIDEILTERRQAAAE